MGAKSGIALKSLQWFVRAIQFLCAATVLAIFSYFLATLSNHDMRITTEQRAVEGISGAGVLYTLVGLVLLCCLAGVAFFSLIAIILDIAFAAAFIYVAYANRHGASSCSGYLDTPYGDGRASQDVKDGNDDGFTPLPSYRTACRLQTAALAVSAIAVVFFIISALVEVALARHHRKEKRYGPGPSNNYTSGSGKGRGGLFSRFRRNKAGAGDSENALPTHTTPGQLDGRQSYATDNTAVGHASGDYAKQEAGYGYPSGNGTQQAQNYHYGDGTYTR